MSGGTAGAGIGGVSGTGGLSAAGGSGGAPTLDPALEQRMRDLCDADCANFEEVEECRPTRGSDQEACCAVRPCGPNQIIAHTDLYPRDASQEPGIGREPRLGGEDRARALDAIVLHEMGHFLGLWHTEGEQDVMYPVPLDPGRPLRLTPAPAEGGRLRRLYSR